MKLKKLLLGILSIASVCTFATACNTGNKNNSSSSDSSFSSSSDSSVATCSHTWSEWTKISDPDCTTAGEQTRTCSLCNETETGEIPALGHVGVWEILTNATCTTAGEKQTDCVRCQQNDVKQAIPPLGHSGLWHVLQMPDCDSTGEKERNCAVCNEYEKVTMPARGHSYENGGCVNCDADPLIPTDAGDTTILEPTDGNGTEYNRFECQEGYYEFTIPSTKAYWLSFSISQSGQYALYSVGGANGCSIDRHYANAQNSGPVAYTAITLDDGNIYTSFSCPDAEFSKNWRATYKLKGTKGKTVKLRFVRIADPAWKPDVYEEIVKAEEINGKAQDGAVGTVATEVPLTTTLTYNQTKRYYVMPTGETVYVAITAAAPRLLGEGVNFISTLATTNPFNLSNGKTEEGDYYVKNYAFFITNYQYEIENGRSYFITDDEYNYLSNPDAVCYQNYVNTDGYYPLTQELKEFLIHYTDIHPPITDSSELTDDNAWLTACYYYKQLQVGGMDNPDVFEVGNNPISLKENENYYATFTGEGKYTFGCADSDVSFQINGMDYVGGGSYDVTLSGKTTILIWCEASDKASSIEITACVGTQENPDVFVMYENAITLETNVPYFAKFSGKAMAYTVNCASTGVYIEIDGIIVDYSTAVTITESSVIKIWYTFEEPNPLLALINIEPTMNPDLVP